MKTSTKLVRVVLIVHISFFGYCHAIALTNLLQAGYITYSDQALVLITPTIFAAEQSTIVAAAFLSLHIATVVGLILRRKWAILTNTVFVVTWVTYSIWDAHFAISDIPGATEGILRDLGMYFGIIDVGTTHHGLELLVYLGVGAALYLLRKRLFVE